MLVKFIGRDAVEIDLRAIDSDVPSARQVVQPGEVIDVSDEIALGREGTPVLDENGDPVINPDTKEPEVVGRYGGLLDQTAKWQRTTSKKPAASGTKKED
jgi:hypothetical protein